ncbi:MAG TPA: hypothetical protein VNW46_15335 [Gemmatimonadaceae bacterium]|jgi:hypothetical protein|nr:hypothetical protein [Gemmatimonadaceae bacterium]
MQPGSRRYAVVATAALTLVLSACGSSNTTGPKTPTPQALATHFDSLYSAYLAAGTSNDTLIARYVAFFFETPPAYGAGLASFTVTTASGTQTWKGFTFEGAATSPTSDSTFITVAFSDLNLTQFVVVEGQYNSSGLVSGSALAATGSFATGSGNDSTFTSSASVLSTGATCSQQTGLAAGTTITQFVGYPSCQLGSFQISFHVTFFASAGLGALSSIAISPTTFNGVRFYGPNSPSHVAPIPSKLAAFGLSLSELPGWHTKH